MKRTGDARSSQLEKENRESFCPLSSNSSPFLRELVSSLGVWQSHWGKALPSPHYSPMLTLRCANLSSPSFLSSPGKPQSHYTSAREGTGPLQATETDLCFVWFPLHAQGCWKTKLDTKSPKLFEEEKGLSACQAAFGGVGGRASQKATAEHIKEWHYQVEQTRHVYNA